MLLKTYFVFTGHPGRPAEDAVLHAAALAPQESGTGDVQRPGGRSQRLHLKKLKRITKI